MNFRNLGALLMVSVLGLNWAGAQGASSEVEQLRRELQELNRKFERLQKEHTEQVGGLLRRLNSLEDKKVTDTAVAGNTAANRTAELPPSDGRAPAGVRPAWSPSSPIKISGRNAFMDVGLVGTFAAGASTADDIQGGTQLGGHDPNQRGFSVQGIEAAFTGAVDPYFRGSANLLFSVDSAGESYLELEEAWLETISLPANLQLRAGQLMTEFGRQNPTHPHTWGFVDTPLVLARYLGPDGLRNPGARVSWLAPTPFYSELLFTAQNSQGETAASFRSSGGHAHGEEEEEEIPFAYRHADNDRGVQGVGDMLFTPRYVASFDVTDTHTVMIGASGAFGPNSSGGAGDTGTRIYGLDLTWKWKPENHHGGFPFVSFQTEALLRDYEAGEFSWDEEENPILDPDTGEPVHLGRETLTDYGFYSQLLYGFRKGWVAGIRFDYVDSDPGDYESRGLLYGDQILGRDPQRAERWRLSPNLTWYPSEFSKIRLQYNYDQRKGVGDDHSVWLQFEMLLGAHAAHVF